MKTAKITQPTRYKRCIITPAAGAQGFDVFDGNGRWFTVPDQRRAKWWSSIHDRIESEFGRHAPKDVPHV